MERIKAYGVKVSLEESSRFMRDKGEVWDELISKASYDIGGSHDEGYPRTVLFDNRRDARKFRRTMRKLNRLTRAPLSLSG